MTNIIITAFEPFNGRKSNTSLEVLNNIDFNCLKKILPVSWQRAREELTSLFDLGPELIVLCGEASLRSKISLERLARNIMDAKIPDNDGVVKSNQMIYDSLMELHSNIDIDKIKNKIDNNLIEISNDCGKYICNMTYYHALSIVYGNSYSTKVVFVHFPVTNDIEDLEINYPFILKKIVEEIKKEYGIKSF